MQSRYILGKTMIDSHNLYPRRSFVLNKEKHLVTHITTKKMLLLIVIMILIWKE